MVWVRFDCDVNKVAVYLRFEDNINWGHVFKWSCVKSPHIKNIACWLVNVCMVVYHHHVFNLISMVFESKDLTRSYIKSISTYFFNVQFNHKIKGWVFFNLKISRSTVSSVLTDCVLEQVAHISISTNWTFAKIWWTVMLITTIVLTFVVTSFIHWVWKTRSALLICIDRIR